MVISTINQSRLLLRDAQTLLGICAGIVADGEINEPELAFLDTWLADHPALTEQWPGADIKAALAAVKRGESTRQALHEKLVELVQIDFYETGSATPVTPTLPLDTECEIQIKGRTFCLTGRFGFGSRLACETALLSAGGILEERVTKALDYLVIGEFVNDQWAHASYGRKIEKAIEYRTKEKRLRIISEAQWREGLRKTT